MHLTKIQKTIIIASKKQLRVINSCYYFKLFVLNIEKRFIQ